MKYSIRIYTDTLKINNKKRRKKLKLPTALFHKILRHENVDLEVKTLNRSFLCREK